MEREPIKILMKSNFGISLGLYQGKYYIVFDSKSDWIEIPVETKDEAVLYFNHKCNEASCGNLSF